MHSAFLLVHPTLIGKRLKYLCHIFKKNLCTQQFLFPFVLCLFRFFFLLRLQLPLLCVLWLSACLLSLFFYCALLFNIVGGVLVVLFTSTVRVLLLFMLLHRRRGKPLLPLFFSLAFVLPCLLV